MKTINHRGYAATITVHHDQDMGEPWKEHDGYGIVSEWTMRDKSPGELVLHHDRNSYRYYDLAETMKLARKDGWGLSDNDKAKLAKSLGRKPTKREIVAEAVRRDFEHLRAWCNDQWHWQGYTTEITTPDGKTLDGDSCWGFDDEDYMLSEAGDNAIYSINRLADEHAKELAESHEMACRDMATITA